jgi:ABC-type dipeptide/oligopeptide/nickel transport system permease subunit
MGSEVTLADSDREPRLALTVRPAMPQARVGDAWSDSAVRRNLKRLLANRSGFIGVVLLLFIAVIVAFGPQLAPYDPNEIRADARLEPPSPEFWFGTDNYGRDLYSRILVGSRLTAGISAASIILALLVGVPVGLIAGFSGGRLDHLLSGISDVFLAFPTIFLGLAVVAVFGVGFTPVILAIAVVSIPRIARITRGEALVVREQDYVLAARTLGASLPYTVFHYVLPNSLGVLVAFTTIYLGEAVVIAAGLSFLGLGVQPPSPEWGALLSSSQRYFLTAPYLAIIPGIAISLLVLAFNLAGDGLRDLLDPRLRGRGR